MKPLVIFSTLLLLPLAALGAEPPYKEVMNEAVRAKQPVVYARVADAGYGVQYRRDSYAGGMAGGMLGAIAGGFAGNLLGTAIGKTRDTYTDSQPTDLSAQDANALAPLWNRAVAQRELEAALAESLASVPLFTAAPVINELPLGAPIDLKAFREDPVLVVEVYASLLTHYRGLQVTALAYELSPAGAAANPKSPTAGRVYRNRFDYVSAQLPASHVKTKDEVKADVEAVKAKYAGRALSRKEEQQKQDELKQARQGTTLEIYREPLLAQWMEADGTKLHEALQLGTKVIAQLIARDLVDYSEVEIRKEIGSKDWGTAQDSTIDRQVRVFFGGPFAGSLVSQPTGLLVSACQGVAFKDAVSRQALPPLCIL